MVNGHMKGRSSSSPCRRGRAKESHDDTRIGWRKQTTRRGSAELRGRSHLAAGEGGAAGAFAPGGGNAERREK